MADDSTTNPTDQTTPLDAGHTTTEAQGSKFVVITSAILSALGIATTIIDKIANIFPAEQKGIGVWIAIGGAVIGGLTQIVYTVQRTQLKIAALRAAQKGFSIAENIVIMFIVTVLALILVTMFAPKARADDTVPTTTTTQPETTSTTSPLTIQLARGWTFHPNVTVGPLAGREWNLTDKSAKWTSNVTLGAQYVFDWKETIAIGGGGAFNVTDTGDLKLAVDAIVAGPKIPINNNELRPALVGMYTAADGKKIAFVGATLSLDF